MKIGSEAEGAAPYSVYPGEQYSAGPKERATNLHFEVSCGTDPSTFSRIAGQLCVMNKSPRKVTFIQTSDEDAFMEIYFDGITLQQAETLARKLDQMTVVSHVRICWPARII
jgi:hypothetical protein